MQRLYFVRHGQTEGNAIGRYQGRHGSRLTALGRRQVRVNARLLAGLEIDALFASPLERARETAEIIAPRLSLPVTYDERIVEWDCGDWSGHLYSEVEELWPEEWAARLADRFHHRGPGCENYPDMFARARPFVEEVRESGARNVAVVSHGMIGKVMAAIVLALDEAETLALHQANDVVFRVTVEEPAPTAEHYRGGDGPFAGLTTHGA